MNSAQNAATASRAREPQVRDRSNLILIVLCSAAFMAMLDVFVVNVAFTAIGEGYAGSSLSDLSWILNGYTIVYAAFLIPAGRMSDRYGRKAGFLVGLTVFTIASALCAVGPTLWWLNGFRVLQAVGAAALTPTSLGLLLTSMPAARRAFAVKVWATSTSVAAAVGPVIGGALVKVSWHWIFLINVPIGLLAFVAAVSLVPDSRDTSVSRIPDIVGSVVLAFGIGALALALVKGQEWGWSSGPTLVSFAVSVLALAWFVFRAFRHPAPVVDPALLRVRTFFWANASALLFCIAFGAVLPSVVLRLENYAHFDPLITGFAVAPGPLMVPLFAIVSQKLTGRLPVGVVVAIGNALVGVGAVVLALTATTDVNYASQILPGWIIVGIGVGFALPNMLASATVDLPPARAATGSAVINASRQLGYVFGVAMLVAILGKLIASDDQALTVFTWAWWAIAAVALVGAAAALGITPKPGTRR
ncbi:MFS transporter [Actinocrispum wychmicini]|uniref:EmrB/QacA subfamily drug resistance transporter n=1 Tax=Actinocrispum wychmicini TaxID=1213861 RepID=A0A4R2JXI4_9PSEU|nr:MFS transporter [Actinocrispum wychmicini]TCO62118.1 EmrB/QacA subfamily drug resistance transporter [Actinocrispum wychmicini]